MLTPPLGFCHQVVSLDECEPRHWVQGGGTARRHQPISIQIPTPNPGLNEREEKMGGGRGSGMQMFVLWLLFWTGLKILKSKSAVISGLQKRDGGERGTKETFVTIAPRRKTRRKRRKRRDCGAVLRWGDSSLPGHTHLDQVYNFWPSFLWSFFFPLAVTGCFNATLPVAASQWKLLPFIALLSWPRYLLFRPLHTLPLLWWQTAGSRHPAAEGGPFLHLPIFGRAFFAACSRGVLWLAVRCQAPCCLDTPPAGERQSVYRGIEVLIIFK